MAAGAGEQKTARQRQGPSATKAVVLPQKSGWLEMVLVSAVSLVAWAVMLAWFFRTVHGIWKAFAG